MQSRSVYIYVYVGHNFLMVGWFEMEVITGMNISGKSVNGKIDRSMHQVQIERILLRDIEIIEDYSEESNYFINIEASFFLSLSFFFRNWTKIYEDVQSGETFNAKI